MAGGEIKGGGLTDSGAAALSPPPSDAGSSTPEPGPCIGTGTHWSDLYNDIFGPTGRAGSCSYQSNCHGSKDGSGARSLAGILCEDSKGCRQSMIDKGLVAPTDAAKPEKSVLLNGLLRLRRADGKIIGFMPQSPSTYLFADTCVARIETWIANGIPDD